MNRELIINGLKYRLVGDNNEPVYKFNGLIWSKTFEKMIWQKSIAFCQSLNYGGYSDWRLPTINELISLIDYKKQNPVTELQNTVSSYYWSATTYTYYTDYAWYVNFYLGYVSSYTKSSRYYVRAVRGGQG